jgi:O-acetyl-ADP-ribose deacetylase (regulator of RNase III)/uncharacterized protein YwgA
MISVLIGDLLASKMQTRVNTVNCVGIMGKGIAQSFKKQNPEMYEDYVDRCKAGDIQEGEPYLFRDLFGNMIVNFPTKHHWKDLSNPEFIEKGLKQIVDKYKQWGITSIAFPPLGCGNGGLEWSLIGPMMYQILSQLDIPVEIYAPWGTSKRELGSEFLSQKYVIKSQSGKRTDEMPSGWIAILEILYRLEQSKYTNFVGMVVFQKLFYIATFKGLKTGFTFKKGKYGPYSPEIEQAYRVLGNANLIAVEKKENLRWIRTGDNYKNNRSRYYGKVEEHEKDIDSIVDLFSRIKSTAMAEEVGTIVFALNELTNAGQKMISEMEFYQYVLNWKKAWDRPEKRESLASTIRELATLSWVELDYSRDLPVES